MSQILELVFDRSNATGCGIWRFFKILFQLARKPMSSQKRAAEAVLSNQLLFVL